MAGVPTSSGAREVPKSWGTAPTPLVPQAYRQSYGELWAHADFRSAAERPYLRLSDLGAGFWTEAPWSVAPARVFKPLRRQLTRLPAPSGAEVFAGGTPIGELQNLPLATRASNAVRKVIQREVEDGRLRRSLLAADVLAIRGAGVLVLIELLAVTEGASAARASGAVVGTASASRAEAETQPCSRAPAAGDGVDRMPAPLVDLLSVAREFRRARTLREALDLDLAALAERTGIAAQLEHVELGGADTSGLVARLLHEVESLDLSSRDVLILRRRLFQRCPSTLEDLGELLGVTRERVRQLEGKLRRRVEARLGRSLRIVAGGVADQIDPIARPENIDRQIESVFHGQKDEVVPFVCSMLRDRLGYRMRGDLDLNRPALQAVEALRVSARETQDDAGLLDEEALRSELPDPSWIRHWDLFVEGCRFHRIDGRLGLRDTKKARVKAAVLNIGRVAAKDEIVQRCGLTPQSTASYLSALPSVARADRTRWGLVEWIDDVYEGVANEILQRIDQDGGATRVERVLEELPRLFGVPEATVRQYLGAPAFERRNGWVRRADPSSLRLRLLEDVIHGRDEQGRPYWCFEAKEIYFRGFSLAGLPPEIACELGCPPNGRCEVPLVEPPDCRPLSLIWRLTGLAGPGLGHLSQPLERLGAQPGDQVRLTLCNRGDVELRVGDPPERSSSSSRTAEDFVDLMKRRRRVL